MCHFFKSSPVLYTTDTGYHKTVVSITPVITRHRYLSVTFVHRINGHGLTDSFPSPPKHPITLSGNATSHGVGHKGCVYEATYDLGPKSPYHPQAVQCFVFRVPIL